MFSLIVRLNYWKLYSQNNVDIIFSFYSIGFYCFLSVFVNLRFLCLSKENETKEKTLLRYVVPKIFGF